MQKAKKKKDTFQFKLGEALPKNGTCSHYRKSFRWFRFPCCGRSFPCDICHDEVSDHESSLANIQICGFCSKSFPVSKTDCINCKSSTTNTSSTFFWEGGKGCRSRRMLNNNDAKKFGGLSKTISNRAKKKQNK